jgi:phosphopantothenate synthetase
MPAVLFCGAKLALGSYEEGGYERRQDEGPLRARASAKRQVIANRSIELLALQSVFFVSHTNVTLTPCHAQRILMLDTNRRQVAETLFERTQRRETEINDALKQEHARREAAVKNMHRLRALRMARDAKINNE